MLLSGLQVLDFTDHRGELGPWLLGRLGAEVIKIEPVGGSPARSVPPPHTDGQAPADGNGSSLQFTAYNDNKRSITIDPEVEADRRVLFDLIAGSEIIFDSGPPGTLPTWGVTEAELQATNPELVHVLITPFGSDGPRANDPASELTLAALGGPMSLQGVRERAPLQVSVPQVWRHTGAEAAVAALVAHQRMKQSGGPQWVDVSAQSVMTWTMLNAMEAHEVQGFDFERAGSTVALAVAVDLRRPATDGYVIAAPVGAITASVLDWLIDEGVAPKRWRDVEWATFDHRALSGEDVDPTYDDLRAALDALCSRYTRAELLARAMDHNATFAPINTLTDLLAFDQLDHRSFWAPATVTNPATGQRADLRRPGGPVMVDGVRTAEPGPVPAVDADGEDLRAAARRRRRPIPAAARDAAQDTRQDTEGGDKSSRLPFEGIKVADFSWIGVGPITAKALADHGATVIRIENENRIDGLRAQAPFKDAEFGLNRSNFYGTFNTSKQSVSVDLGTGAGVDLARRLTDWADVVIDSFRPGTLDRLGLGPEAIRERNPSVITVTTSLLGRGGPLSAMAGYGFHASAIAGFTELVGWPDLGPDGPWMAYTDTIAPRFLTTALLAAIDQRQRTGEGCHLEGAQLEMALQLLAPELMDHQLNGTVYGRMGNRHRHLLQGAYPCLGHDQWCTITVATNDEWLRLAQTMGGPSWVNDATYATPQGRLANQDTIDGGIAAWTAGLEAEEVERLVLAAGVAAGRVQRSVDLRRDPQYLHRGFYRRLEHSEVGVVPYAGHQYRIRGYDHGPRFAAPALGQHTFEVFTDLLGLDTDTLAEAIAGGAIG